MSDVVKGGVTRLGWAAYALAVAVIGIDQLSKFWILNVFALPDRETVTILPFFHLTMVWNRGVSFGFLRADADLARWGLAAFSVTVSIALTIWVRRTTEWLKAVSLGLVIGGAIGNVIDRIRFGAVADFLDFSGLYFPWVFNVADSAITVGIILLLLDSMITRPQA